MRCSNYVQFAIVQADTAQHLTERLNKELYRLRTKSPRVEFEGLTARIMYEESEEVPESLEDEYSAVGVHLVCNDCPFFEPRRNKDGSRMKSAKWGFCGHKDDIAKSDGCACEFLFAALNTGEVKICLPDQVSEE